MERPALRRQEDSIVAHYTCRQQDETTRLPALARVAQACAVKFPRQDDDAGGLVFWKENPNVPGSGMQEQSHVADSHIRFFPWVWPQRNLRLGRDTTYQIPPTPVGGLPSPMGGLASFLFVRHDSLDHCLGPLLVPAEVRGCLHI